MRIWLDEKKLMRRRNVRKAKRADEVREEEGGMLQGRDRERAEFGEENE